LIGIAVASYLVTSFLAMGTKAASVPPVDLGMGQTVLARLQAWTYIQVRWLDDPRWSEFPRSESRFRCLVTDEEGGELALLRANPQVQAASVARLLTAEFPWGTDEMLSLPATAPVLSQLSFVSGKGPSSPDELALPERIADLTGLAPGSIIEVLVTDPEDYAHSSNALEVSGVFRGGPPYVQRPLGWLPQSYDIPWMTTVSAHYPRVLGNLEPNAYLIDLRPGAGVESFLLWFTEREWMEGMYLHLQPRYSASSIWSDWTAADSLATFASAGMSAFAGIVLLSLSFVVVGVFTIFVLSFLERRREIAILKSLGLTGGNIASVFWLEAAIVGAIGLLLGTAGAAVAVNGMFGASLSLGMILRAAAVTAAVTVTACLLPAAMARVATVSELLSGQSVTAVFRRRVGAVEPGTISPQAPRGAAAR
jgi:hypothetical protein